MAESQSRYGIMESLNSKKIEAQKRLASMERELEQQQMAYDNTLSDLKMKLSNENSTYEDRHAKNVRNLRFQAEKRKAQFEMEQKLARQAHERQVEADEREIKEAEENFVSEHDETVLNIQEEINKNTSQYEKYKKIRSMEVAAIEKEISGYDEALNDLKEVSKESTKKD